MDGASRLLVALGHALGPWPASAAVLLLTGSGCLESDAAFTASLREGAPDLQRFPYTLASTPVGEAGIRLAIRGPGMAVQGGDDDEGRAMAARLVAEGAPAVLLARIETGGPVETAWAERWDALSHPSPI
jgi:hypothetical protein